MSQPSVLKDKAGNVLVENIIRFQISLYTIELIKYQTAAGTFDWDIWVDKEPVGLGIHHDAESALRAVWAKYGNAELHV